MIVQYFDENKDNESEMLFDLINLIQEWIDEHNIPPSDDNFDLVPTQNGDVLNEDEKHCEVIADSKSKMAQKPRILMLHAYKQNGKIFRTRSKQFVKLLLNHFDLSFPNAPTKLNGTPSCPDPRCWYQYPKVIQEEKSAFNAANGSNGDSNHSNAATDGLNQNLATLLDEYTTCDYIGFFEVIQYFYKYLVDQCDGMHMDSGMESLPFIGIIAFSQGATMGTLLMWLATLTDDQFEEFIMTPHLEIVTKSGLYGLYRKYGQVFRKYLRVKACVLMSGHLYPLPKQLESSYCQFVAFCKGKGDENGKMKWKKLQCASLHTMSPADNWVPMQKAKDLCGLFENVKMVEHPNGHVVYNNKYVSEFMVKMILE